MKDTRCSFCLRKGKFEYLPFGQDSAPIKVFVCPECKAKLPEKLRGLTVKYKGTQVGEVLDAEWKNE